MHRNVLAVLFSLAIACCASPPPSDAGAPPPGPGRTALAVLGTPFLIALKIPVCAASAAIAAPLAGLAELTGTDQSAQMEDDLGDGLEKNCGPPYVLTP